MPPRSGAPRARASPGCRSSVACACWACASAACSTRTRYGWRTTARRRRTTTTDVPGRLAVDPVAPAGNTRPWRATTAVDHAHSVETFLFTDIEGSSRLWEREPARMQVALARHDALARRTVEASGGAIVKMTGD